MDKMGEDKDYFIDISDNDIYDAMKDMQGYLDITPKDIKHIYKFAFRHAYERIVNSVTAVDIMTKKVVTVGRHTVLSEVAELMALKGVSGVPVLDDNGGIAGVISSKDFLAVMGAKDSMNFMEVIAHCLRGGSCVSAPISKKTAEDIMTSPAITVKAHVTVGEISSILSLNKINRVPVVDDRGELLGIISRADIVRSANIMFTHISSKDA